MARFRHPLARHSTTVGVYPADDIMPLLAQAYDFESDCLKTGDDSKSFIDMPSGSAVVMSPRLRTLHLLCARCCNCGLRAQWVVEKRIKGVQGRSRIMFVDDPWKMPFRFIEADHVVPVDQGGPSDAGNLVPMCGPCNSRKGCRRTHVHELRWRVRDLFDAVVALNPGNIPQIQDAYAFFRLSAFVSGRGAARYPSKDALQFMATLCPNGVLPDLMSIRHVSWPLRPDLDALDDGWLRALAGRTQACLDSLYF